VANAHIIWEDIYIFFFDRLIWEDILQLGFNDWGYNPLKAVLCRLAMGSAVYNIWCTQN
jgi:hypothetical protein